MQIIAFAHQNSTIALSVGLLPEEDSLLDEFKMRTILKMKDDYDSVFHESSVEKESLAVMIPVLSAFEEEYDRDRIMEFKAEMIEAKNTIKKANKKVETIDLYLKEINAELTKQDMYK